jgi:Kef-type K+ transport system membrane component KefB
MERILLTLAVVTAVVALAPLISELLPARFRLPGVVLFLIGGIVIGPSVLGWARPEDVAVLSTAGMGFLFLLAGYEFDPKILVEKSGRIALKAWFGTLALALLVIFGLFAFGLVDGPVILTIALTTTALGTLLPILSERGLLGTDFGRYVLGAGAVGELLPIVAMALFLGTRGTLQAAIALVVFLVIVAAAAFVPGAWIPTTVRRVLATKQNATAQFSLRLVVALLFLLLFVSESFGFDAVLGAFAAGMLLRRWRGPNPETLEVKLDAVGYGFFIPVFFVASGMDLNLEAIVADPLPLLLIFGLLFVIRGLPALFWYRKDLVRAERWQMVFYSATALPLLVALAEIGADDGHLSGEMQASLVGAGALSVLVFPLVASAFRRGPAEQGADGTTLTPLERDSI